MTRSAPILAVLTLPFTLAALAGDLEKVNGSVRVEAGQQADDVSSVNGSVHIGEGATVRTAETVNGSVTIQARASAGSVETVNGAVVLHDEARVSEAVSTVNGALTLRQGADVGGRLSNVNGRITLASARVGGGIETVSGDIEIGRGSRVEGGIHVRKPGGWFGWGRRDIPRIVIGPDVVVEGRLQFDREVELFVSDRATIGPVEGATPTRFSGDTPPSTP